MDLTIYNQVKDGMQTGDMILWRSNSLLGKSIRFMTQKDRPRYELEHNIDVNHVSGVLRIPLLEQDRRFIPESLEHGPSLNILSSRVADFDGDVWWYPVKDKTDNERLKWGQNALQCIGQGIPYGYMDIVKFAIGGTPDINPDNGLFCSEYYMYCWGYDGVSRSPNWLPRMNIFLEPIKL